MSENDLPFDNPMDAVNAAMGKQVPRPQQQENKPKMELPTLPQIEYKVELKYKYEGLAEDGRPVETIVLSDIPRMAKDKVLVIAWSPSLKKEVMSQVVPRIE